MTNKTKNVYAFIDSQNLNVGVQKFGWKMDWQKFRRWLGEQYGVTKAFMFIGYVPEFEALYEQMHESGYMVVLKPTFDMTKPLTEAEQAVVEQVRESTGGGTHAPTSASSSAQPQPEEKKPVKGNIDADLVLWAMKEMSNYDKMILVSGDGDFFSLVEYMEQKKRLLHILTPSFQYSQLFNRFEEYIVRLDQHKRELRYYDRRSARSRSEVRKKQEK